ncbi:S1C family serine protease [Paenibacillus sp. GCM10027627]|uniref:S1C family serine protease n=1 Tax=unclassified Paenibacillus TaxID=185978 RepID=UPI003631F693
MQKKLLSALLVLAFVTGALLFTAKADADIPAVKDAEDVYELAEDAMFYMKALRSDGTIRATGSGVMIDAKGIAATAYHVVKGADKLEAVFPDGRVLKGVTVLKYDELTDAAVLQFPGGNKAAYAALPIRSSALKAGEQVFALGYPLKETLIVTEGIVNHPKAKINGRNRILTSAQIVSGMSGGPLIDRYGRLVGIISGSMRTMDNIHLVLDMEDLQKVRQPAAK